MSPLSFPLASKISVASSVIPAVREIRAPKCELRIDTWDTSGTNSAEESLPSGVASMEHWLDLNA